MIYLTASEFDSEFSNVPPPYLQTVTETFERSLAKRGVQFRPLPDFQTLTKTRRRRVFIDLLIQEYREVSKVGRQTKQVQPASTALTRIYREGRSVFSSYIFRVEICRYARLSRPLAAEMVVALARTIPDDVIANLNREPDVSPRLPGMELVA